MYTQEDLEKLSIYQLRLVARAVGVKSPTTKKRSEIISQILAIQNGEQESYFPNKKKGRPVKDLQIETNMGAILCLESVKKKGRVLFKDLRSEQTDKVTSVSGYLAEIAEDEYCIVDYDSSVAIECLAWVPARLISKTDIRSGNFILCEVVDNGAGMLEVSNFMEVEGQNAKGYTREQFENKQVCFDKHAYFSCSGGTVFYGDRVLVSGDKFKMLDYMLNLIMQQCNYCESIVVLGLNLTPESVEKYKKINNVELFYSLFSDNFETQYFTYKLAVNRSKRLAELGKRVIFVVFDLDHLYDNFRMNEREKSESIKNLYGMSRSFEQSGSFTVIGISSKGFYEKNTFFKDFIDMLLVEQSNDILVAENLRFLRNEY